MAVVRVRDLRKVYGDRAVVDGVSFDVEEGEIFGILGPNGAGKTTTVECIEGLRVPDGGEVEVLGLDPHRDATKVRAMLGAQLQESRLHAALKVREALRLFASFYDGPADGDELLDLLGLQEHRNVRFGRLSGGQQQRLSIALALIGRPRVAVLDELTTGLDPQARRDTWGLIERIRAAGVTILLVTHFMEEAERLCDRVALLGAGRVVALDTPAGIVARVRRDEQVRFSPSGPVDPSELADLPKVTSVSRSGRHLVVSGREGSVQDVLSYLAQRGVVAAELRVDQPSLEDAFLALGDRGLADDLEPDVAS